MPQLSVQQAVFTIQRTAFDILQGLVSTWINYGSRTCDICIWGMMLGRVKVNDLLGSGTPEARSMAPRPNWGHQEPTRGTKGSVSVAYVPGTSIDDVGVGWLGLVCLFAAAL